MKILFFIIILLNFNIKTILTTGQNGEQPESSTRTENAEEIVNSQIQENNYDDDFDICMELTSADLEQIYNFIDGNDNEWQGGQQGQEQPVNKDIPADKTNKIIKNLIPNKTVLQPKITEKNQLFENALRNAYNQSILTNKNQTNASSSKGKNINGKGKCTASSQQTLFESLQRNTELLNMEHKQLEIKMTIICKEINASQGKLSLQKYMELIREKNKIAAEMNEVKMKINANENIIKANLKEEQDVQRQRAKVSSVAEVTKVDSKNINEILEKFKQKHSLPNSPIKVPNNNFSRENGKRRKLSESTFQTVQVDHEKQSRNEYAHKQFNILFMEKHLKLLREVLNIKRDQIVHLLEEVSMKNNQIVKFSKEDPLKQEELEELKRQFKEKNAKLTGLMEDVKLYESHIEYVENKMKSEKESLKKYQ